MMRIAVLGPDPAQGFPDPATALHDPPGLLAMGGDLAPRRLIDAYVCGIFPWYSEGEPILWWSPDPRMVLEPGRLHLPRRFRRFLRTCGWEVAIDRDFPAVIRACATVPRRGQRGTWITQEMIAAYCTLHRLGWAHSVEVRERGVLVGGIYGLAIGRAFFGESMFSLRANASRVALTALCRALHDGGIQLLDGQVESPHLRQLGFAPMPRQDFLQRLTALCRPATPTDLAHLDPARLQPPDLATPVNPDPAPDPA